MPYDAHYAIGPESTEVPVISVVSINKDHGRYIEENIVSVLAQRGVTFEHIIIDGGSTDESLAIIDKYPHLVFRVEPHLSADDALAEAVRMARGRNIMMTTSTDGYLGTNWFRTAVDVLDADSEVSMVYADSVKMTEEGLLGGVAAPAVSQRPAPQKFDLFLTFIESKLPPDLPELNYCIRKEVFLECYFSNFTDKAFPELKHINALFRLIFKFMQRGYLTHHVNALANFARAHKGQYTEKLFNNGRMGQYFDLYGKSIDRYRALLRAGQQHEFRNGRGVVIGRFVWPVLVFNVGADVDANAIDCIARNARVVCFEPNIECADHLRERFGVNPLMTINPVALGVTPDTMRLCSQVTISVFSAEGEEEGYKDYSWKQTRNIPVRTFHSAVERYGLPDYCKINIRFKPEILQGLSEPVPVISFACRWSAILEAADCVKRLRRLGYHLFNLTYATSKVFRHQVWISSENILSELQTSTEPHMWGDIYASSRRRISPEVLPLLPSSPSSEKEPWEGAQTSRF